MVDIAGALVTSAITGALFATDVLPTGMPVSVLLALSAAAAGLGAFGSFRLATAGDPASTLRALAGLNTAYCAAAGASWWLHFDRLTTWGRLYFPAEIVVVLALALVELRASQPRA